MGEFDVELHGPGIDDRPALPVVRIPKGMKQQIDFIQKNLIRAAARKSFHERMETLNRIADGDAVTHIEYVGKDGTVVRIPVYPKVADQLRAFEILAKVGGLQPRPDSEESDDADDEGPDADAVAERVIARMEALAQTAARTRRAPVEVVGGGETGTGSS